MVESSPSASSRIHLESNTLNGTDGDTGNNGSTNSSADLNRCVIFSIPTEMRRLKMVRKLVNTSLVRGPLMNGERALLSSSRGKSGFNF